MHRIYAVSYAVYYWSEWLFLLAFASLFVIPFTSLEARFAAWCVALVVGFASLAAGALSEALCRALLRRRRQRREFSEEEARRIEFLEENRRVTHVAQEASRLAVERHQQSVEAWWIDNRRG
jgi:peptidoglycan/LPS O-acetylase OafA/YrhL